MRGGKRTGAGRPRLWKDDAERKRSMRSGIKGRPRLRGARGADDKLLTTTHGVISLDAHPGLIDFAALQASGLDLAAQIRHAETSDSKVAIAGTPRKSFGKSLPRKHRVAPHGRWISDIEALGAFVGTHKSFQEFDVPEPVHLRYVKLVSQGIRLIKVSAGKPASANLCRTTLQKVCRDMQLFGYDHWAVLWLVQFYAKEISLPLKAIYRLDKTTTNTTTGEATA